MNEETRKYESDAAELDKKVAYLSNPQKVLQDLRSSYEAAAKNLYGKVDPEVIKEIETMQAMFGKVIGEGIYKGQCAALVQSFTNIGHTSTRKEGENVKNNTLVPMAPIATLWTRNMRVFRRGTTR